MEIYSGVQTFYACSRDEWRNWLEKNHNTATSVWLIIYRKESDVPSVYYPEAVDEALCFGWIDSKPNKRDATSYYQFFAKRNPKSNWSKVNKDKVTRLIEQGLMHESGLKMIEVAKQTGTWSALDDVDNILVPDDMMLLLSKNKVAHDNWNNFSKSSKRGILEWIQNAKRVETRLKRIEETITLAEQNIKANHYRQ